MFWEMLARLAVHGHQQIDRLFGHEPGEMPISDLMALDSAICAEVRRFNTPDKPNDG